MLSAKVTFTDPRTGNHAQDGAAAEWRLKLLGVLFLIAIASCGGGGSGGGDVDATTSTTASPTAPPPPPPPTPVPLPTVTDSSQSGYVVTTAAGWTVVPLLTVGDKPSGSSYALVGKPDGLGAIAGRISSSGELLETESYLTIFMNHELPVTGGAVRAHGTTGAFVSQWTVDLDTLRMSEGRDLVARTFTFSGAAWSDATGTLAFDRLCSADLPAVGAFYNSQTGNGFNGRLFMNGEEAGSEGRAFAHVVTGS